MASAGTGTITVSGGNAANGWNNTSGGTLAGAMNIAGNIALGGPLYLVNNCAGHDRRRHQQRLCAEVSGSSILTVNAAQSYSGGTNVNGGTLAFAGISPPSGTINTASGATTQIINNSSTEINSTNSVTYTGAGTLLKTGSGVYHGSNGPIVINLSAGGLIDVEGGSWVGNNHHNTVASTNLGSLKVAAGALFTSDDSIVIDALIGAGSESNWYQGQTLTIGAANGSGTWSGKIYDNGSGLLTASRSSRTVRGSRSSAARTPTTAVRPSAVARCNWAPARAARTARSPTPAA